MEQGIFLRRTETISAIVEEPSFSFKKEIWSYGWRLRLLACFSWRSEQFCLSFPWSECSSLADLSCDPVRNFSTSFFNLWNETPFSVTGSLSAAGSLNFHTHWRTTVPRRDQEQFKDQQWVTNEGIARIRWEHKRGLQCRITNAK